MSVTKKLQFKDQGQAVVSIKIPQSRQNKDDEAEFCGNGRRKTTHRVVV